MRQLLFVIALIISGQVQAASTTAAANPALPGSNGLVTGSGAVVLQSTPTLTTPNIGAATGTSVVLTGAVTTTKVTLTAFVFANIATALTANGEVGFCSDCTIANPCAGAGTGAIAKRLNGVNVCN